MKARPILFSAPMIRALLDGKKTQTRRVIEEGYEGETPFVYSALTGDGPGYDVHDERMPCPCPYGVPGDLLYVREAWAAMGRTVEYRADRSLGDFDGYDNPLGGKWRPSIHMPRWASRITLRLTDVRVERLQDIRGMDALREGVSIPAHIPHDGADLDYACREYRHLWESINGPGSWDANPWVWAITFEVIKANVDEVAKTA